MMLNDLATAATLAALFSSVSASALPGKDPLLPREGGCRDIACGENNWGAATPIPGSLCGTQGSGKCSLGAWMKPSIQVHDNQANYNGQIDFTVFDNNCTPLTFWNDAQPDSNGNYNDIGVPGLPWTVGIDQGTHVGVYNVANSQDIYVSYADQSMTLSDGGCVCVDTPSTKTVQNTEWVHYAACTCKFDC